jgi:hypothetical protein
VFSTAITRAPGRVRESEGVESGREEGGSEGVVRSEWESEGGDKKYLNRESVLL